MATAGSTNGIIHLVAIARRLGIGLPLAHFDEISRTTPLICNVAPSGTAWIEDVFEAGGVPAIMAALRDLLELEARTVTGQSVADNLADIPQGDPRVIGSLEAPFAPDGGLAILFGNLAPSGAVIKHSAATPELLRHRGRALVFDSPEALDAAMLDDALEVTPEDVLVLRNQGPRGAPGMPHRGNLPLPRKLRRNGVLDMVRISDATMSGTAAGTIVLHVTPEAAVGGALGLVRTGDEIVLDVPGRRLDVVLSDAELAERRRSWTPPRSTPRRGYNWLYVQHVLQADQGCDFDFLGPEGVAASAAEAPRGEPLAAIGG
jgi:dihydroxy-acid dehydratase